MDQDFDFLGFKESIHGKHSSYDKVSVVHLPFDKPFILHVFGTVNPRSKFYLCDFLTHGI